MTKKGGDIRGDSFNIWVIAQRLLQLLRLYHTDDVALALKETHLLTER